MAKRLLSAFAAIVIGILILWLDNKELLVLTISAVSVASVYEVLLATKYLKNRSVTILSLVFVLTIPFVLNYSFINTRFVSFAFVIGLFVILLFNHKRVDLAEVALVAFVSLCIPFSLSSLGFLYEQMPPEHRIFSIVFVLTVTWINDTGAFFVGTFLGKHKLAPDISPKKTWEGFAGGVVVSAVIGYLLAKGYETWEVVFSVEHTYTFTVNAPFLSLIAAGCAMLGVLGDLSASILKRECSVKDFGNVLPGHGGVLDRFDSILFAVPFAYLMFLTYFQHIITEINIAQ